MSRERINVDDYRARLELAAPNGRQRARKKAGDAAEDVVEAAHEWPHWDAVAEMKRRTTQQKPGRDGRTIWLGPQGPDFSGYLRDGATHVEIEVKRESGPRWEFRELTESQIRQLTACDAARGISAVLVLLGPHLGSAAWCAVPWGIVAGGMSAGLASLNAEELLTWRWDCARGHYVAAPWLRPGVSLAGAR